MSNSKLTLGRNNHRKIMKRELLALGGTIQMVGAGVTICTLPEFEGSKMLLVSISICSDTETKVRRKVGEYHALTRMFSTYEYIKVVGDQFDIESFAYSVA